MSSILNPEFFESSGIPEELKDRLRVHLKDLKTLKDLKIFELMGIAYEDLGIVVNNRGEPVTLNDGSLIFK